MIDSICTPRSQAFRSLALASGLVCIVGFSGCVTLTGIPDSEQAHEALARQATDDRSNSPNSPLEKVFSPPSPDSIAGPVADAVIRTASGTDDHSGRVVLASAVEDNRASEPSDRYVARQFPTSPNHSGAPSLYGAPSQYGAAPTGSPYAPTNPGGPATTVSPPPPVISYQPGPNDGMNPSLAPSLSLGDNLFGPGIPSDMTPPPPLFTPTIREADLIINGYPARTGRIMLGGAVNSDAGLTGQLTIDERNFDITRWPRSFQDLFSGTAFRGAGETFRLEAAPGNIFQRYTINYATPNLFRYLPLSMSVSGFLYDRRFNDWDEQRLGGRTSLGYRITPDLSLALGISGQNVEISRPRILGVAPLDAVLGNNEVYSGNITLTHDTRNSAIQPSDGHFLQFNFEEAFGDFDYSRFEMEYRTYWLLTQRADSSGKQTISYSTQLGFSGNDTPIFENFFAGGYATLRGFDFRGASPVVSGVEVGGRFQWLNSIEYMFPITADDAFRGVTFVDFGTVESDVQIKEENFRVAPGFGFRVAIPMMGPAPLAFDFAFPVAKADTDSKRMFSFYMSLIR